MRVLADVQVCDPLRTTDMLTQSFKRASTLGLGLGLGAMWVH